MGDILWELESPTTVEQVQNSKKCQKKDTSPGLDGITTKNHMGVPALELAKTFNVWLLSGCLLRRCKA